MSVLYVVAALATLAVPVAIVLGSNGRKFDLRGRYRPRMGGRREADPQPA